MDIRPALGTDAMNQTLHSGDTVTMPETVTRAGGQSGNISESDKAGLERLARALVGSTGSETTAARRTTVHGPLPRNNRP